MKKLSGYIVVGALGLFLLGVLIVRPGEAQSGGITYAPNSGILNGFCNGVIGTANATTYIITPGGTGATSTACTMTGSTDTPLPISCTARNLYVVASAAGGQAGSGLTKLFVAGSGTTLTCTLGTGTSCNDTTHLVPITAGQQWSIRVTTAQATDTTANIRVAFQCQ